MAKINMDLKKNPIPTRAPEVRSRDFLEVATGYDEETAISRRAKPLTQDLLLRRSSESLPQMAESVHP